LYQQAPSGPQFRWISHTLVSLPVFRIILSLLVLLVLGGCAAMTRSDSNAADTTVVASRFFTSSDGVRLHVLEAGAHHTGPVIVLVPGWSMPASLWQAQLGELGRRHHVVAFDPRGQGLSDVPADGYHVDRRADDLHDLIAQYPRVILAGWSLGALEALQYVHRHGETKLAALVLVDSSVGEGPDSGPSSLPEALRRNRRETVRDFIGAIFKTLRAQEEQNALLKAALRMTLEHSIALFPSTVPREHWRNLARGVTKPLLYVVTPQFAAQARELKAARPATQVELFQTAGHALFADEPERFNRLLEEFAQDR